MLVTQFGLRERPFVRFLIQFMSFVGFSALLVVAGIIPPDPTPEAGPSLVHIVIDTFKIAWWLAAAWLIVGLLRFVLAYKRRPAETRFVQDIVAGLIYICAGLKIFADVFDIRLTSIMAASGVVAIVLGLALQNTLSDVFSGFVLNLAKPYHPGDWVILDGDTQGEVIETTWRETQILTPDNDVAIIPNSVIAKAKLVNASRPEQAHRITIDIRLDPTVAPLLGCVALQNALVSCNNILRTPAPRVAVLNLNSVAIHYEIRFFVARYEQRIDAQNELLDLVFRHCASAGIRLANSLGPLSPLDTRFTAEEMPRRLLDRLPIFAPLSEEERVALVPGMKRRIYAKGDVVAQQDSVASALSILSAGVLIAVRKNGATEQEALRLGPGESFGEAGVLAGAATMFEIRALTEATVYEVAKAEFAPILAQRPEIVAALGEVLARRRTVGSARLEEFAGRNKREQNLASRLSQRVKDLFGIA